MPRRSAGLRPAADTAAARRAHAENVDTTSFISESDLPAWLRQVVETEEAESRAAKQAAVDVEARNQARAAEGARVTAARAAADAARQERHRAARVERERATAELAATRSVTPPPSLPVPESQTTFDATKNWSLDRPSTLIGDAGDDPSMLTGAASGSNGAATGKGSKRSSSLAGNGAKLLMVFSVLLIAVALLLLLAPGLFT